MYENLPVQVQNLLMFNYVYSANIVILFLVSFVSIFYLFYYKKNMEKPTVLMSVGIMRLILTTFTIVSMFMIPFFAYTLNPSQQENAIVSFYVVFYVIFLGLMVLVFIVDFIRNVPFVVLKMAGVDAGDPTVDKMYKSIMKEMEKIPFLKNGRK